MDQECLLRKTAAGFQLPGVLKEITAYGNGHINDTYCLSCEAGDEVKRFILQRINKNIFTEPEKLMENILGVTGWLKKKILDEGGDPERETLTMVPCRGGGYCCRDSEGEYWRVCQFIEGASSYERPDDPEVFYQSAVAVGRFQRRLSDYPIEKLYETIPDFHNTVKRFEDFKRAVREDVCGRAQEAADEIRFICEREAFMHTLCDLQTAGELPVRVTHNDTKLNNVLIDDETGRGICVIDLDTVMPGLSVLDFGDAIRFGASTAPEDEPDLSKVHFDLELYRTFVRGFVEGCGGALTDAELAHLPTGAVMITLENAMRFLADYLEGDHYYKIHRERQNLDRCRNHLRLVKEMEEHLDEMRAATEFLHSRKNKVYGGTKMDIICMGEMLIDFTPGKEERSYVCNPGGAPANACIAIARNGLEAGFLGRLGNDDFGKLLKKTLEEDGVKVLCPELTDAAVTTLAFVTLYEGGERSFTFVRKPGADILLDKDDVSEEMIQSARMLHAGSVGMSANPSRDAHFYAMQLAKKHGKLISYDVNYRNMIWSFEDAKAVVDQVLPYVDLLKVSDEELDFVGGEANIPALMQENGITVVIETLGSKGAKYFFGGKEGTVEGHKVKAVDATGAGDAFWGGFLSKLLMTGITKASDLNEDLIRAALAYGNASGGLCVQKMGGIPALPTKSDIEIFLAK